MFHNNLNNSYKKIAINHKSFNALSLPQFGPKHNNKCKIYKSPNIS